MTGIQGVKDSREMLKNYIDLKVWQRSYPQGSRSPGFKWFSVLHLNPRPLESSNPFWQQFLFGNEIGEEPNLRI